MATQDETREEIEEIVNNNEPINEEIKNEINEEEILKAKSKPTRAKARPKIKITKQAVEAVIGETVPISVPAPSEEQPKQIDKSKEIVKCSDCNMDMTQHTLKYIHKRRGFCKADKEKAPETVPEPITQPLKPKITNDSVNDYVKENLDIVSNFLRNGRAMKTQKRQMNARPLLNSAF